MKITEVEIDFIKSQSGLVGFASMIIDNALYISNIGIYKKCTENGYRLTYPKRSDYHLFHPINPEGSAMIEEAVTKRIREILAKSK